MEELLEEKEHEVLGKESKGEKYELDISIYEEMVD